MQKLIINGKEIDLNIFSADFEISFKDENTGLEKVIECEEIIIKPKAKYVRTLWCQWDVTPSGERINKKRFPWHTTTPEDFEFFTQAFGVPIKKYAVNGLFKTFMASFGLATFAVFDDTLQIIESQPVPFPAPDPIDDIDISDAFGE